MLVQLSDFHVGARSGGDPLADLDTAVGAVADLDPAPDAVLVTGDLADHGLASEYAAVKRALEPLTMPVHVLPGNHDDREALRAAFPLGGEPGSAPDAPYRYAALCGPLRVLACDTLLPGRADGALHGGQLAWLAGALADDPSTPTIVAMHHPPLRIGMPALDDIGLDSVDRDGLASVLAAAANVIRVVAGHVHMAALGRLGAREVATSPSTWRCRAALELGGTRFNLRDEPAGFALHTLVDGSLVTHAQPL